VNGPRRLSLWEILYCTAAGYGFLVPWLIGFLGLTVGPMVFSLYLAFTKYNLFTEPEWIGFDNFVRMFTEDPNYIQSVQITLVYVLVGTPIKLFNHGRMRRDFTYIDDVTRVVSRLVDQVPADGGPAAGAPAKVYNVGNNHPEELTHVVAILEQELGRAAVREMLPMQPGDVTETFADVAELMRDTGFRPQTSIEDGLRNFVTWYRDYHRI